MIDLTLNSILIPDITGYTPPFGTKVARTPINKGGLSTQEVNNNIIASFVKMRGVVVTVSDSTSVIEYDAKLLIEAESAITLTLGNATYRGCKVSIVNTTRFTHTLICTSVSTNAPIILPNTSFEIIWTGTAWKSLSAPAVGKRVTQFPQEEPPSTTYPCTKWELLSFDGAFFRTEGTNANQFIDKTGVLTPQGDQNKSHVHSVKSVFETYGASSTSRTSDLSGSWSLGGNNNAWEMGLPASGSGGGVTWNKPKSSGKASWTIKTSGYRCIISGGNGWGADLATELNFDVNHSHDFNHYHKMDPDGGDEARPINYTIRVWKRIA